MVSVPILCPNYWQLLAFTGNNGNGMHRKQLILLSCKN
jgi:hypothetical protein